MNGIHDLGGREGYGPVVPDDPRRPVRPFTERWQGRVFALNSLMIGARCWNADRFRHAIERIDPHRYFAVGYYGRWLAALETLVREVGPVPDRFEDASALRPAPGPPRFAVGDAVRTRNHQPSGHTRLPAYARTRRGRVARVHPAFVYPDTNAHEDGEHPQHVYAIAFSAEELYGDEAEPGVLVHVDLFEDYLEPA